MTNSYLWFMSSPLKTLLFFIFLTIVVIIPDESIAENNCLNVKKDNHLNDEVCQWVKNGNTLNFTENRGQMADKNGHVLNNLLFKTEAGGVDVYITTTGISYVFTKIEKHRDNNQYIEVKANKDDSIIEHYCRADMDLVGADIKKENIVTEGESVNKTDYYLGGICPNGVLNVHNYTRITIKNIYPGIDWVLYTNKKGLKYDFVVHPNADYTIIKLKYNWTDTPKIASDGSIKITTPMGYITEGVPVSYMVEKNNRIETKYRVSNNEIGFLLSNYNKAQTLIIDPTLIWATYYGGNTQDETLSINSDGTNVWVAGFTESSDFPVYNPGSGAYFQGAASTSADAFILKFNTSGVLKWATYYGGSKGDEALAINSDSKNVWVTGFTSSSDFPTLNPGGGAYYQNTLIGNLNAFVLQFSTAGILKWATYYGGNGTDYGESINSDGTNVWLTGFTTSTNFPTLNPGGGALYQSVNADSVDAFVLQFDTSGIRKWATYYGGNGDDYGQSISSDGTNIWVTGYTRSTNLQVLDPGSGAYYQSANAGGNDAFIAQFNTVGICKWATYYGGSGSDEAYSINSDKNYVWLTGATTSKDFPVINPAGGAYYQATNASIGNGVGGWKNDVVIARFSKTGVCQWSTYYGGSGDDYGSCINSDGTNIWITGYTNTEGSGTGGFPLKDPGNGAFYLGGNWSGVNNTYILEFNQSGISKWGTWLSLEGFDQGSSIESDGINVWFTGIMLGGESSTYKTMVLMNPGGGAYYQDTVDGYYTNENNRQNLYTGYIAQFTACSPLDVTVNPKPAIICKGDSVMLTASGGINYSWSPSTGLNSDTIANPIANPDSTTTYFIKYTSGKCKSTDTITVTVVPMPAIGPPQVICWGNSVELSASGGISYYWLPNKGLSNDSIADPNAKPSRTTTYSVTITNKGCSVKDSVTITVNPLPVITVCCNATINAGQSASINVTQSPSNYTYNWLPTEGLSCTNCPNPVASPFTTTTYSVTVIDSLGCDTVGYVTIDVNCDAFVPDAFSPNGDGQNDMLYVRGDCVKTIDFEIFDRWGNKVFETNDKNLGWNGMYKGGPMNTGSYVYYLTGTKYDGTSIEKKGSITLVR